MADVLTHLSRGVLTITLNRGEQRNTMTYEALDSLHAAVVGADEDPEVRAVVVTGAGPYFCAGTDLTPGEARLEGDPGDRPWRGGLGARIAMRIFGSWKPFIAAMNGTAAGIGLTMTLPMDIRIGATTARFGIPYVRRGILPESCSSWFLPRVVGLPTALDWAVTGRIFGADEALAAGLITESLPADEVLPRALSVAEEIASTTSAVSVALTRRMLWTMSAAPDPREADVLERAGLRALVGAPDVREGFASFRERRDPHFTMRVPADLPDLPFASTEILEDPVSDGRA